WRRRLCPLPRRLCRCCRGRWFGLRAAGLDERKDVLLRDAAAAARALDRADVDTVLGGDPGDDGRHERLAVSADVGWRRLGSPSWGWRGRLRRCGRRSLGARDGG